LKRGTLRASRNQNSRKVLQNKCHHCFSGGATDFGKQLPEHFLSKSEPLLIPDIGTGNGIQK
jgi:hypothetical protein